MVYTSVMVSGFPYSFYTSGRGTRWSASTHLSILRFGYTGIGNFQGSYGRICDRQKALEPEKKQKVAKP